MDKTVIIRIISFTLAGGDFVQTIPGTIALYRKQWEQKSLSPLCFFYAMARYMSVISLITNGYGAFSTNFTVDTCRTFFMLPNVTALLSAVAVQCLIFIRTWAISKRSKFVFWGLGGFLVAIIPVQVFGIVYHRVPNIIKGNCKGKVLVAGEPDWNIVFYIGCLIFDFVACAISTGYLIAHSKSSNGLFQTSKFVRKILRNGIIYTLVVSITNMLVVCEFTGATKTGIGSTLPLAIVMICAAHLILSTQRGTSDHPSSSGVAADSSRSRSRSRGFPLPGKGPTTFSSRLNIRQANTVGAQTQDDIELQSGVFVLTETYQTSDNKESNPTKINTYEQGFPTPSEKTNAF